MHTIGHVLQRGFFHRDLRPDMAFHVGAHPAVDPADAVVMARGAQRECGHVEVTGTTLVHA